jgi:hypothetical protein
MKKDLLFVLIVVLGPICGSAQSYLPLAKGNKWEYGMGNHSFNDEIVQDNFLFNGKKYFTKVRTITYASGGIKVDSSFLRITSEGTIRIMDPKSKKEMDWIPAKQSVGQSWLSTDGEWKFTIVEISAAFRGLKKAYENCIVIKEENIKEPEFQNIYYHYYSKGLGYAGMKVGDGIAVWLNNWTVDNR